MCTELQCLCLSGRSLVDSGTAEINLNVRFATNRLSASSVNSIGLVTLPMDIVFLSTSESSN